MKHYTFWYQLKSTLFFFVFIWCLCIRFQSFRLSPNPNEMWRLLAPYYNCLINKKNKRFSSLSINEIDTVTVVPNSTKSNKKKPEIFFNDSMYIIMLLFSNHMIFIIFLYWFSVNSLVFELWKRRQIFKVFQKIKLSVLSMIVITFANK